jgi:gas vesicle protein
MDTRADDLRAEIEATRSDMTYTVDEMGERLSPRRIVERRSERVRNQIQRARNSIMGVGDQVSSAASDLRSHAGSGVGEAAASATQAPRAVIDQTRGSPLAAGAIAFATGFLIACALPSSSAERQGTAVASDKASPLVDQAKEAASQVQGDLKDSAQQVVEDLKVAAGSAADEVKSSAQDARSEMKGAATQAVKQPDRARSLERAALR